MIFHESFWVVVGGAAPVIALAAVVSTSDIHTPVLRINTLLSSLGLFLPNDTVTRRLRSSDLSIKANALLDVVARKKADRINNLTWPMLYLSWGNLGIQAALLCVGLLSIALHTNLIPPWIAITAETVGVTVLAIIQLFTMSAKGIVPQMEELDSLYYPESQQQDQARGAPPGGGGPEL